MYIRHNPYLLAAICLLLVLAIFLRWQVGKRRFNRRNWSGRQVFPSYSQSVFITLLENLALFIATASVIAALILTAIYCFG